MNRTKLLPGWSGWRVSLAAALMAAVSMSTGTLLVWADTTTPVTVTPANHTAAVQLFQQARNLYQQDKFQDANVANDKALQLDPTLTDAQLLHKILQSKLGDNTAAGTGGAASGATTGPATPSRFLNAQQISAIRLQELSDADTVIRGKIPRKTLDALWNGFMKNEDGVDLSQAGYNKFVSLTNFPNQLREAKRAAIPQLSQTVEITSDPIDMIPFRTTIHSWVLQNCATSACHGGDKAGKFRLYHPIGASNDALIYTNFYILSMYTAADGGKLINRDEPDKSLLVQYALPKTVAAYAHPGSMDVHRFGDENAVEYQNIQKWIKSLAYPRPDYGIVYELPGQPTPAPAPTTKPAHTPPPKPH